jgi:hypothetical protein
MQIIAEFLSDEITGIKYSCGRQGIAIHGSRLHQLMNYNLNDAIKRLYFKGKSYELLSLYFNTKDDPDVEAHFSGEKIYQN